MEFLVAAATFIGLCIGTAILLVFLFVLCLLVGRETIRLTKAFLSPPPEEEDEYNPEY